MPEPESLPRVIDRYELTSVLGSGGFATVYRARHVHTRQELAVKLLHPRDSDRWLGEARAAAAVQHRNVVRVLDCGRVDGSSEVFIVMDFVAGPTLAEVIEQAGPMPPARAVGIAAQLLDGLAAAHALGIVHRDIKPPNVILTRDETGADFPKILDFGVSKQLDSMGSTPPSSRTLDGTAIGTPGYMAPELFGGARHADARADVYAVAATLYEMLSGRLPFAERTYEELVVAVSTQRPAPLQQVAPHVSPEIAAAVDRGLARDRDARWSTAEQFAAALRGALMGIAPPASQPFAATLEAQIVSPRVPTLGVPDPVTMRTAPPPPHAPSTASRDERRSTGVLGWVVGAVGLALAAAAGAVLVTLRLQPQAAAASQQGAPISSLAAQPAVATSAVNVGTTSVASVTPVTPVASIVAVAGAETHPSSRPPSVGGKGIRFTFPAQVVGDVNTTALDELARSIIPQGQRCRPASGVVVARVQIQLRSDGTIAIAQPSPNEPGDVASARCLGALMKDAATPNKYHFGSSGIATFEATLDPR